MNTTVISLGGSIIAPQHLKLQKSTDPISISNAPDIATIGSLISIFRSYLQERENNFLILVVGGGAPARSYQNALRSLQQSASHEDLDQIGIQATKLNAELMRSACGDLCTQAVIHNPETQSPNTVRGQITVAAGWKPGFSTDYVAVVLAEKFRAQRIINISNIDQIYSADPRTNKHAVPLNTLTWTAYSEMVGTEWVPGKNLPFDPIAAQKAAADKRYLHFVGGSDMDNIANVLRAHNYRGTTITPD